MSTSTRARGLACSSETSWAFRASLSKAVSYSEVIVAPGLSLDVELPRSSFSSVVFRDEDTPKLINESCRLKLLSVASHSLRRDPV